ncbi:MAG TPA: Hsp70 family protein [Gemmataceae bacterium]|nr:Hsp70 family protein [Gemmataceae bacterium]
MARYLVGIDLGTTNSALAYIDLRRRVHNGRPEINTFAIPQLVNIGECRPRSLLPSFLYLPGEHDLPPAALALPWDPQAAYAVGEFARQHGSRVPGRQVTSAKSWLSHAGVDRTARLLPWTSPPDVERISPVEASARYLKHMVDSWNHLMAAGHEDQRLENLPVVITVPASFDEVARNLTVAAAKQAGLQNALLLEEPQAAFYCWLGTFPPGENNVLQPGSRALVVDIGGGTSDFSLIRAVEEQGELAFVREAVGDHLLLGGDNMDLALAKIVEGNLKGASRLDAAQYGMLTQACRDAKEKLLEKNPPASYTVTVMGRGRQVIGGSLHATLTPADIRQAIFDGFFPLVSADAEPARGARSGLHEMGLPYVNDPGITRHLSAFLRRHASTTPGTDEAPAAILFNGGVFQPEILRHRLVTAMRPWFDQVERRWDPALLTTPSLDLAVAWGAAYYAWLRHSGGRRIGGGIARSYYIAVDTGKSSNAQAPGDSSLLCIVPQHLQEGQEIALPKPELELALGQPVAFPLFTSTVRGSDRAGDLIRVPPRQLLRMPPLHTILRGGKRSGAKHVPVTLAARSTEIGTLELWCVGKEADNRWRLEFNVRDIVVDEDGEADSTSKGSKATVDVWPEDQVQAARAVLKRFYLDATPDDAIREVTKELEAAVDASRSDWPTGLCRRLWEFLLEIADQRRRSAAHLARWYHLVGYCLRPGFGDSLDRFRVEQLWKLLAFQALSGPAGAPSRIVEGGADYWIMWRRVGGGLNASLQQALFERLRAYLLPGKGKSMPKPGSNELAEMWRAVASLERLDSRHKQALGQALLKSVRRSPAPTYAFWSLTRLGARRLLYGPLNTIVHPEIVAGWIEPLIAFEPSHPAEVTAWGFCLAQLARRTGQRALDVDEALSQRVAARLKEVSLPPGWVRMVEQVVERQAEEQSQVFGESLPIGLRLSASPE